MPIILQCRPTKMGAGIAQSVHRLEEELLLLATTYTSSPLPCEHRNYFLLLNQPRREDTIHRLLVLTIRTCGTMPHFPNTTAWGDTRNNFTFLLLFVANRYNTELHLKVFTERMQFCTYKD